MRAIEGDHAAAFYNGSLMSSLRRKRTPSPAVSRPAVLTDADWRVPILAVLVFFAVPLFAPTASIQWDALDVHYSSQRYLSEELFAGRLPVWTPYLFSGFPFLADPQVGAFYPLNWPFLLIGAGPKAIQAELALHGVLAAWGMLLLLRLWTGDSWAASFAAIAYPLSGYFAGHASHVGMAQAASLFPWLLYFSERALRADLPRWLGAAGAVTGLIFLAGHLQTALYSCAALFLYLAARIWADRGMLRKAPMLLAGVAVLAVLVSAVMTLPGIELSRESIRASRDFSSSTEGALTLSALATLAVPDALGVLSGQYQGPGDATQYYFYGGALLLPLAAFGLMRRREAIVPCVLVLVSVWFMLGPAAGLYSLVTRLPGLGQVRAPVHAWFVAAVGLTWLAALGVVEARRRVSAIWLAPALCAVLALDLCVINAWSNPLTYARQDFATLHARGAALFREKVLPVIPAGRRLAGPDKLTVFGSMNSALELHAETTYGYNPLELRAYSEFRQAADNNPRLLDALSASHLLDTRSGAIVARPASLPKAWFPLAVRRIDGGAGQLEALSSLDPAAEAVVGGAGPAAASGSQVEAIDAQSDEWRIRYRASTPGLMALSLPFYPGWTAQTGGQTLPLMRINHALSGVEVPAGVHELHLKFRSRHLWTGACLSLIGCLLAGTLCWRGSSRGKPVQDVSHG